MAENRPPIPRFTFETATQKVRMAEDAWNTRDPERYQIPGLLRLTTGNSGSQFIRKRQVVRGF
jgi:uncharacterized protein